MSNKISIARENRMNSTGAPLGVPIDELNALSKIFLTLKHPRLLCIWLTLWLTGKLVNYTQKKEALPQFKRIRANRPSQAHSFRITASISKPDFQYVEFAMLYESDADQTHYQWQPIPACFNRLFLDMLRQVNVDSNILTKRQVTELSTYLHRKYKRPVMLKYAPMCRKDVLIRFISTQAKLMTEPSHQAKAILQPMLTLSHKSALSYVKQNTDSIRYQIHQAQCQILDRLWAQVPAHGFRDSFKLTLKDGSHYYCCDPTAQIIPKDDDSGLLPTYDYQHKTRTYTQVSSVEIGSKRLIDTADLQHFFAQIHEHGKALYPGESGTLSSHYEYYNWITYELILQYEALTGHRPTHHLIATSNALYQQRTVIKDKAKVREIFLNSFIVKQIELYKSYQRSLLFKLGITPVSGSAPIAQHLIPQHAPTTLKPVSAKEINQFVKAHLSHRHNAYFLRHHFSQFAQMNVVKGGLSSALHDALMGHSNYGEHLGHHMRFHCHDDVIFSHLEQLTQYLQLEAFCHVN